MNIIKNLSLDKKGYDLLTLHRPSNVDNKEKFLQIISNFESPTFSKQIVLPASKNNKKARETGLLSKLKFAGIRAIDPLATMILFRLLAMPEVSGQIPGYPRGNVLAKCPLFYDTRKYRETRDNRLRDKYLGELRRR